MKNILFYDTETSDQADFKAPPDAPHQPRLLQLGAIMTDLEGNEIAVIKTLIKPDGWTIQPGAQAVHGIIQEQAEAHGIPLVAALAMFNSLVEISVGAVCHNSDFDSLIMRGEYLRTVQKPFDKQHACTMKLTTPICQLPGGRGGQFKWPKLGEAYKHCTGQELSGAHDALVDVRACKDIYFWLKNRKKQPAPALA